MDQPRFKPSVNKNWLFLIAGLLWTHVGLMLCKLAYNWLYTADWNTALIWGITGFVLAMAGYHFMFSKIVKKNINRINDYPGKSCIFAFQPWKSYFLVIFMIALGINLRNSPLPKHYLAAVYIAVGLSLIISSTHYYILLIKYYFRNNSIKYKDQ